MSFYVDGHGQDNRLLRLQGNEYFESTILTKLTAIMTDLPGTIKARRAPFENRVQVALQTAVL